MAKIMYFVVQDAYKLLRFINNPKLINLYLSFHFFYEVKKNVLLFLQAL